MSIFVKINYNKRSVFEPKNNRRYIQQFVFIYNFVGKWDTRFDHSQSVYSKLVIIIAMQHENLFKGKKEKFKRNNVQLHLWDNKNNLGSNIWKYLTILIRIRTLF